MIDKVTGNRIGSDINEYLIGMWKQVATADWLPPKEFSEIEYHDVKSNKDSHPKSIVAYAGFSLSFGGKWFGGWCRGNTNKGHPRDYVDEQYRASAKQFPLLKDVHFYHAPYYELSIPPNSIIYCDPPYRGTTSYKDGFDHEPFYTWCRNKHKEGHTIFVSEYNMPDDFICVWEKEVNSSLTKDTGGKTGIERLFTLGHTKPVSHTPLLLFDAW